MQEQQTQNSKNNLHSHIQCIYGEAGQGKSIFLNFKLNNIKKQFLSQNKEFKVLYIGEFPFCSIDKEINKYNIIEFKQPDKKVIETLQQLIKKLELSQKLNKIAKEIFVQIPTKIEYINSYNKEQFRYENEEITFEDFKTKVLDILMAQNYLIAIDEIDQFVFAKDIMEYFKNYDNGNGYKNILITTRFHKEDYLTYNNDLSTIQTCVEKNIGMKIFIKNIDTKENIDFVEFKRFQQ